MVTTSRKRPYRTRLIGQLALDPPQTLQGIRPQALRASKTRRRLRGNAANPDIALKFP